MTAERAVMLVKKVTYFGEFGYLNSSGIRNSIILMFWRSSRDKLAHFKDSPFKRFPLLKIPHFPFHVPVPHSLFPVLFSFLHSPFPASRSQFLIFHSPFPVPRYPLPFARLKDSPSCNISSLYGTCTHRVWWLNVIHGRIGYREGDFKLVLG